MTKKLPEESGCFCVCMREGLYRNFFFSYQDLTEALQTLKIPRKVLEISLTK